MSSHQTRHSLIKRARDTNDEGAWEEFVSQYRRFICYMLSEIGVDSADVDDVCQQVLVILTKQLDRYDRTKGTFRNWLGVVIRNAAFGHFRKAKRRTIHMRRFGEEISFEDPGEGHSDLDALIEEEWTTYIANLAMARTRVAFKGQAIEIFEQSLNGFSAEEIAKNSRLELASVYTLRKRVKKRLYLEIRAITAELEP